MCDIYCQTDFTQLKNYLRHQWTCLFQRKEKQKCHQRTTYISDGSRKTSLLFIDRVLFGGRKIKDHEKVKKEDNLVWIKITRTSFPLSEPKQSKIIRLSTNNEKTNFIPKRQKSQKIHSLEPYYNPLNRNKMGLMKGQKNITVIKGKAENHRKYSKEKR